MKAIKRISALLLAVMLIASFTVCAFAEDEPITEGEQPPASEATAANIVKNAPSAEGNDSTTTADTIGNVWINENSFLTFVRVEGTNIGENEHPNVKWERNDTTTTVDIKADIVSSSSSGLVVNDLNTGQTINVTVGDPETPGSGGNITSENVYGISVNAINGGTVTVTTAGDIKAGRKGVYTAAGTIDEASSGKVTVTTGNITAGGTGIEVNPRYSGSITVTADSVNADNYGIYVQTANGSSDKACTAEVTVKENVTGLTGITVDSYKGTIGQTAITVGTKDDPDSGTVKGDIVLDALVTGDTATSDGNTKITLWKVDGDITGTHSADVINYFVRQAALKAEDGSISDVLIGDKPSDTAKEEQTISFKVTPAENNKVDKVTFIDGGEALTPDSNGFYSFKAPKFGGIMLNATFKQDTPVKPDPPEPKPEPKPTAGPVATTCKLTFELDGGTIDGESEYSKTCSYGQHIKLPIPEKEGFTFGGWETTVRGKTVTYEGGARYTVTAAKTFTAIWLEA